MAAAGSRGSLRLSAPTPTHECTSDPRASLQLLDLGAEPPVPFLGSLSESLCPASPAPALHPNPTLPPNFSCQFAAPRLQGLPEPPNWAPAREVGRLFPLATGRGNICGEGKRAVSGHTQGSCPSKHPKQDKALDKPSNSTVHDDGSQQVKHLVCPGLYFSCIFQHALIYWNTSYNFSAQR